MGRATEQRIANELLLKIGIRVSPPTVNKYLPALREIGPEGNCGDTAVIGQVGAEIVPRRVVYES